MRSSCFTDTLKDLGLEDEFEFRLFPKEVFEGFQTRTRKIINNRKITENVLKLWLKNFSNAPGDHPTIQSIDGLNFQIEWKFNNSFHKDNNKKMNEYIKKSLRGRTRTTERDFRRTKVSQVSLPGIGMWNLDLFSC